MKSYIVYAKINSKDYIADINSSAFLTSTAGWVRIDEGSSDLFRHAQKNYLPDDIITKDGAYRYKLVDGKPVECAAEEIAAQEEANKPIPPTSERSVWDELDMAYQQGINSI